AGRAERPLQVERRVLVVVQADEALRLMMEDLPRHLRADRTRSPGDEYALAAEELADRDEVELDGRTAQEVVDVHLARRAEADLTIEHLPQRRHHAERYARVAAMPDDAAHLRARRRRRGHHDLVDAEPLHRVGDARDRPPHGHAVALAAALFPRVIEER